MHAIRHLLAQRELAILICVATLLLRLLVPGGYMIDRVSGHFTITICSGIAAPAAATAMPGMHGDMPDHGKKDDRGKVDMPCAFSGLSAAALSATDPLQLAALIVFVMGTGFARRLPPPEPARAHLRPPLRGPPAAL
ncbi:hypothetical protein [uncultured Sphingomonas sp.]|uniref:hypothetical protein n=1 Tax=uncultured Sphingomonas sp. TaxID=158754 RepID=UPI0030F91DCA